MVPGWTQALQMMTPGDTWELFIPPQLGYGSKANGGAIPAGSVLVFELKFLAIKAPGALAAIPLVGPTLDNLDWLSPKTLLILAYLCYTAFQSWRAYGDVSQVTVNLSIRTNTTLAKT